MKKEIVIVKLGGSRVVKQKIDVVFIKRFKELLESFLFKHRFVVVCGGGQVCRTYQAAARVLEVISNQDLDMIGIKATELNAELIRAVFGELAYPKVINNYHSAQRFNDVIVASGSEPGHSTDYCAAMFARRYKSKILINITDVPYIYDSDPKLNPEAKPLDKINVKGYLKIIGNEFQPGMNVPFDPLAAKAIHKFLQVVNVATIEDIEAYLKGENFHGTILHR